MKPKFLGVLLAVSCALAACGAPQAPHAAELTPSATLASSTPGRMVLAISVDGLNPAALKSLGTRVPNYRRLLRQGASTLNARTAYELTDTLPNHTGMMTGRPVASASGHRVTFNEDRPGSWLAKVAGHYLPGMFDGTHDRAMRTALYVSKVKFDFLDRSWNGTHGARDRVGANNGRDKIDLYVRTHEDTLARRVVGDLVRAPRPLVFWHIVNPDKAGHAHGFMSQRYLDAVRRTDSYVGTLLAAVDRHPWLRQRLTVILTSDHGGKGASHRDPTKYANYRIPFLAWGAGVKRGANLYALNPARLDPGTGRPTYAGRQPIRNTDVADLALTLLGVPPVVTFANRKTIAVR